MWLDGVGGVLWKGREISTWFGSDHSGFSKLVLRVGENFQVEGYFLEGW